MAIYGYARVSTLSQVNGTSLEEQQAILTAKGCTTIIAEQFTGKTTERPKLDALIASLESGDKLIVTKLDRLARSVVEGKNLIVGLIERGVEVEIVNMGVLSNAPINKLTLDILLAFAEFEHAMIVERCQNGKARAKLKEGFTEGRPPKFTKKQVELAVELLEKGETYREVEAKTGLSKSTLQRAKRAAKKLEV